MGGKFQGLTYLIQIRLSVRFLLKFLLVLHRASNGTCRFVSFIFFLLFICAYNVWVISPPFPPPLDLFQN
jgi:hypothetical protein